MNVCDDIFFFVVMSFLLCCEEFFFWKVDMCLISFQAVFPICFLGTRDFFDQFVFEMADRLFKCSGQYFKSIFVCLHCVYSLQFMHSMLESQYAMLVPKDIHFEVTVLIN